MYEMGPRHFRNETGPWKYGGDVYNFVYNVKFYPKSVDAIVDAISKSLRKLDSLPNILEGYRKFLTAGMYLLFTAWYLAIGVLRVPPTCSFEREIVS